MGVNSLLVRIPCISDVWERTQILRTRALEALVDDSRMSTSQC